MPHTSQDKTKLLSSIRCIKDQVQPLKTAQNTDAQGFAIWQQVTTNEAKRNQKLAEIAAVLQTHYAVR